MLVFSFGLIQLPLFNYLGYEFSASVALILPFIIGISTITAFRRLSCEPSHTPRSLFKSTLTQSFRLSGLLLGIPFIIATANIFIIKNCSYGEGLLFFLLLPCITTLWSIALAFFCAVTFRKAYLFYFLFLTFDLFYPLYLGYFTPAIYSYNFIYGYFPGFSYDEILTITPTLLFFRGVTLICSWFLVLSSWLIIYTGQVKSKIKEKILAILSLFPSNVATDLLLILFIALSLAWLYRFNLGFESNNASIQKELSATYQTKHFIIYYAPGSFSIDEIEFVGREHEFRFEQDEHALDVHPTDIISSYIYPDTETKRKFIGTGTTNIAKPWRKEIHLNKDSWQDVLKHELVHILAGDFGLPIIHAHYNIGLNEGLATAIDGDWGNRTLHQYAAGIKKFGIATHPERLVSADGFATQASSVSYVLMGSFCQYLIEKHGIQPFKKLFGGESVHAAYGKSYPELVNDWQASIDTITVPDSWKKHIEYYFKRPSIFAKECARTIARINQAGYVALANNDIPTAQQQFNTSLHGSWNTEAFVGLVRTKYLDGKYENVINMVNTQLNDSIRQASTVSVLLLYGNSLWVTGDTSKARKVFTQIIDMDLSERYNEAATLRLLFLDDEQLSKPMATYFTKSLSDSSALLFLDSLHQQTTTPLLNYLQTKNLFRLKRYNEVLSHLQSDSTNLPTTIESGRNELIAQSYFWLNDYLNAKQYFTNELQFVQNESAKMSILDEIKRCEFFQDLKSKHAF